MPRLPNISKYCVSCRSAASGVVEAVAHADAVQRLLRRRRSRSSGTGSPAASRTVGATSMHVVELVADLALGLDAAAASARSCRCGCRPSARRPAWSTGTACPSRAPSRRRSGCRTRGVPRSSMCSISYSGVARSGASVDREPSLVVPMQRALGRGAVVADDEVDERVVEDPELRRARRSRDRRGGRRRRGSRRRPPSGAPAPA